MEQLQILDFFTSKLFYRLHKKDKKILFKKTCC